MWGGAGAGAGEPAVYRSDRLLGPGGGDVGLYAGVGAQVSDAVAWIGDSGVYAGDCACARYGVGDLCLYLGEVRICRSVDEVQTCLGEPRPTNGEGDRDGEVRLYPDGIGLYVGTPGLGGGDVGSYSCFTGVYLDACWSRDGDRERDRCL